jgi:hypothetical protein
VKVTFLSFVQEISMRDYITLGSAPYDEPCKQVGRDSFAEIRKEASTYASLLKQTYPDADIRVKTFEHDFGSYCEACVFYNDEDEESVALAFSIDENLPATWADIKIHHNIPGFTIGDVLNNKIRR